MTPLLRRFRRNDEGTTAIEFALISPLLFAFLFAFWDLGAVMLRQVTLNSAVDVVSRNVRLTGDPIPGQTWTTPNEMMAQFTTAVCGRTYLLSNCEDTLVVDMRSIPPGGTFPPRSAPCIARPPGGGVSRPVTTFDPNATPNLVYVRVCAPSQALIKAQFGIASLQRELENDDGDIMIHASTAFLFE